MGRIRLPLIGVGVSLDLVVIPTGAGWSFSASEAEGSAVGFPIEIKLTHYLHRSYATFRLLF